MAKPRKEDQDEFERMRDVMERLVRTPPKPHEESKVGKSKRPSRPKGQKQRAAPPEQSRS